MKPFRKLGEGRHRARHLATSGAVAAVVAENLEPRMFLSATAADETAAHTLSASTSDQIAGQVQSHFVLSPNDRFVAFYSFFADLVPDVVDGNFESELLLHDLQTGTNSVVSVATNGTAAGTDDLGLAFSPDGRYLAFLSNASNLVSGVSDALDLNGDPTTDLFVRDLQTSVTRIISVDAAGTTAVGAGGFDFSPDSRFIAFGSAGAGVVGGVSDTNGASDVFIRDLQTDTTTVVSVTPAGNATGNGASDSPAFSPDGHLLAFSSVATDLVLGVSDTNATSDLFVRNLQTNATSLVSVAANGTAAGGSFGEEFSPDSRYYVFESAATNLVAGVTDANGESDLFVRDLQTQTTAVVTVNAAGTATGNGSSFLNAELPSWRSSFSGTASLSIAFVSDATDLVGGGVTDSNGERDVFVRNLTTGTTNLIGVNAAGTAAGNAGSKDPQFSADGRLLLFFSGASDLAAGVTDTNSKIDVFVRNMETNTTTMVSVDPSGTTSGNGQEGSGGADVSADGRYVAFTSTASNLAAGITDTNGVPDLFVRDLQTGTTELVTINAAGTAAGNAFNSNPEIGEDQTTVFFDTQMSADGRSVVFTNFSSDLTAAQDPVGDRDLFVRDLTAGVTTIISATPAPDVVAPTVAITAVSPDPRTSAVDSVTITFSEAVSGFELADLSLTRDGAAVTLAGTAILTTSDHITFALGSLAALTATPGTYALTLTATGAGIADAHANPLAAGATDTWVTNAPVSVDATPPAVSLAPKNVTDVGTGFAFLIARFTDAGDGVDAASVASGALFRVTGPGGFDVFAQPFGAPVVTDSAHSVSQVYHVQPPDGVAFHGADNGTYLVNMVGGIAQDLAGNSIAAQDAAATFTVNVLDTGPDLTATAGSSTVPASLVAGVVPSKQSNVTVSLGNAGDLELPRRNVVVSVYLGAGEELNTATDARIGQSTVKKVGFKAAGASKPKSVKVKTKLPAGLGAGDYRVFALVDDGGEVAETREQNNVVQVGGVVHVAAAFVDLSGTAKPLSVKSGKKGSLSLSVRNDGNVRLKQSVAFRVLASPDGVNDGVGETTLFDSAASVDIDAGKVKTVKLKLPAVTLPAGAYTLFIVIDPADQLGDANLNNNLITGTLTVQ